MSINEKLYKKRILLMVPSFFGYYKEIEKALKERENHVDIILENFVDKSILYRCLWSKNKYTKKAYTCKYYQNRIKAVGDNWDIIFVIRGEALDKNLMQKLKNKNPNAKFIMYQWDSVENNPNALDIQNYFDRIYTFDILDAEKLGWKYRPLFFVPSKDKYEMRAKKYDFAYIGTLYYKRARLYQKIKNYCEKKGYGLFDYLYTPKFVFALHKYILKDEKYNNISWKDVKFRPLKNDEIKEIYHNSKILVDYTADNQSGLTMRTIESLGYECKLITNNKKIRETDIYEYGNIYVYDLDNFEVPTDFIKSKYNEIPKRIYESYSIDSWIDEMFFDVEVKL